MSLVVAAGQDPVEVFDGIGDVSFSRTKTSQGNVPSSIEFIGERNEARVTGTRSIGNPRDVLVLDSISCDPGSARLDALDA